MDKLKAIEACMERNIIDGLSEEHEELVLKGFPLPDFWPKEYTKTTWIHYYVFIQLKKGKNPYLL